MEAGAARSLADALAADHEKADVTPAERAMLDYAVRLTREPATVGRADVEALRHHGLDDRAIHDLACITAYFAFVNRVADGLGVELEEGKG